MRVLLTMSDVPWPTHGGREVYSHHLAEALLDEGHEVHVLLCRPADEPTDWPLVDRVMVHRLNGAGMPLVSRPEGWLDYRWRRYWGWSTTMLASLHELTEQIGPALIAAAGADALPALSVSARPAKRVWLALDEPALFQCSVARASRSWAKKLRRWKLAGQFIAYQQQYRRAVDAVVAVSPRDAAALEKYGWFEQVLTLPNGVDTGYFAPMDEQIDARTAVFWGRLDFEPNTQALRWFVDEVWPGVLTGSPEAKLRIMGRNAPASLERYLSDRPGVSWIGAVDDIRSHVSRSAAVVLPMQSGAGIKNKLLEAAAMAKPIIASPRAVDGLVGGSDAWRVADEPAEWREQLAATWQDDSAASAMGDRARRWVTKHHSWRANARGLVEFAAAAQGDTGRDAA